jgi:hypothetical protein
MTVSGSRLIYVFAIYAVARTHVRLSQSFFRRIGFVRPTGRAVAARAPVLHIVLRVSRGVACRRAGRPPRLLAPPAPLEAAQSAGEAGLARTPRTPPVYRCRSSTHTMYRYGTVPNARARRWTNRTEPPRRSCVVCVGSGALCRAVVVVGPAQHRRPKQQASRRSLLR